MANQKSYSIVINGIKESISDVDILIHQLEAIEKKINGLGKQGIKIDTKGLKDLEKIKIPEISIEGIDAKALKKEMQQLEKDIAKGAKTVDGEYTNTLNGLRAKLRDLKGELGTLDLDVDGDAFADLTDEIKDLNDKVKAMEQDYGTFSRNVGNYTESMVDALNEFDGQMYETADGVKEVVKSLDSLKDKQKIDIQIGDEVIEFENLSQAIGEIDDMAQRAAAQMLALKNAGKENTEEYEKLNAEFQQFVRQAGELEKARKYSDNLKDSFASTTRGLDMAIEAFELLGNTMQMASGIAGLFGQDQEKIQESINRTVQIMAILQSSQKILKQLTQENSIATKAWNVSLAASEKVMKGVGIATNTTSKAMKGLKYAIAATGIGLLVIAIGELISLAGKLWDKFSDFGKAAREAAKDLADFNDELNQTKDEMTKIEDLKFDLGLQDTETTIKNKIAIITKQFALLESKLINSGAKISGNWKKVFDIDTSNTENAAKQGVKLLETLVDEYQDAKQIVEDYSETKDKEKNQEYLAAQAKVVAYEQLYALVDGYKNLTKELKDYNKEVAKQSPLTDKNTLNEYVKEWDKAFNTIEKNRIEAMQDGFKKRIAELVQQRAEEIDAIAKDAVRREEIIASINAKYDAKELELVKEHNKELSDTEYEIQSNLIAAQKDGLQKRLNELNLSQGKEIRDAEGNERKILSIQQKYNKLKKDEIKLYTEEVNKLIKENEDDIYSYIFEIQKKNTEVQNQILDDRLKEYTTKLKNFNNEIMEFYEAEGKVELKRVKLLSNALEQLTNFGSTKVKLDTSSFKGFFNSLGNVLKSGYKAVANDIKTYYAQIADPEVLKEKMDKQLSYIKEYTLGVSYIVADNEWYVSVSEDTFNSLEQIVTNKLNNINREYQLYGENIDFVRKLVLEKEKEYYTEYLKVLKNRDKDAIQALEKEGEKFLLTNLKKYSDYYGSFIGMLYQQQSKLEEIEKQRYQDSLKNEDKWLEDRKKQLTEAMEKELQNINLTEEQKKEIEDRYQKEAEASQKQYNEKIKVLFEEHKNNIINIENETNQKRSDILSDYHKANLNQYQKYYTELNKILEKNSNASDVDMGSYDLNVLGDLSQFVVNSTTLKKDFGKLKESILKDKTELEKQLQDGVISQEAFNVSMEELNQLEEQTNQTLASLSKSFIEYTQSAAALGQAVVGIWAQMYSQIADLQYQNEMYRIEQLREAYDKETEILQDKLEEQQELYEKYNENVQSIEDELSTARGDRRLFLLDQINEEMMKREQAWAQEQKIQKQQEQLEKKKEALEQRQKAAEQKRNKQNQKVQVAQATASTALAVTNALSVQPWFLGVALAAVAAAMGAVQIATIAKQKFASGGVIQGKSHSQGGVPVMNGSVEVEGGEYITNKVTTSKNVDVLTFINSKKKKLNLYDFIEFYSSGSKSYSKSPKTIFADGGQLPSMQAPQLNVRDIVNANNMDNRPIYVSVQEIENVQNRVRNVRAISGLDY
jgi:chromosome segregation ATPase